MFKSSERLRHEAAQRSLDRVASTWRSSRTTWFDGTPESIDMRLAATDRLLAVARSGFTPAHLELTVEAENARRELLAAKHQLLANFLDDSARAFKGSKREAAVDPFDPESDEYTSDTGWKTFDIPGDSFNDKHDWMMKQLGRSPEEAQEARDAHYPPPSNFDKFVQSGELPSADAMRSDIARWTGKEAGLHEARGYQENEDWEEGGHYADYNGKCPHCKSDNIDAGGYHGSGEYDCMDCGKTFHPKVRKYKSSLHEAYGQHSFDDRIEQAYDNRGRLDEPLVGVNPGDGIYRNHPGMIDGYDEGDYMGSQYGYDASSDPNFVPADYLGPAGRDMGGKHRAEAGLRTAGLGVVWEGKACPDCAMAIANGDDSGASDEWSWDKLQNGIAGLPGDKHPIISCPDCEDGGHGFQRGPCDLCGSPYDGEFHRVVTLGHEGH